MGYERITNCWADCVRRRRRFGRGQIVQRFYLEPIHEQRRIIGEVAYALIYDANVVREGVTEETVTRLRRLASSLRATVPTIPSYAFFARQGWVPPADNVMRASTQLIGWSNGLSYRGEEGVQHRRERIAEELDIRIEL